MLLPVVERELRVAARRRGTYRIRVLALLAATVVFAWQIFVAGQTRASIATQGQNLFAGVAEATALFSILIGVFATSDCIGAEKREGTLGLLFLTDLKALDVVLGKLVANSLNGFYAVVAVLPVLGVPILFGGVTFPQFLKTSLALVTVIVFSLSTGIFVSSFEHNARKAMFLTLALLLAISLGPLAPSIYGRFTPMGTFFLVSPLFPVIASTSVAATPNAVGKYYWGALAGEWSLILLLLAMAVHLIPAALRDKPASPTPVPTPGGRFLSRRSDPQLLAINPFAWLAARGEGDPRLVWLFLASVAVIFLFFWCIIPSRWLFSEDVALWTDYAINIVLKIWIISEASRRLADDRRSGAFELLLSTPLTDRQIIRGQWLALWNRFGRPILAVLAVDVLLGICIHHYDRGFGYNHLVAAIFLVVDSVALGFIGMWFGLVTGNWTRTILIGLLVVLTIPWLASSALLKLVGSFRLLIIPTYWNAEMTRWEAMTRFWVWSVADVIIIVWALSSLRASFRRIIAEGV
ncbi:MAG TPA: hypothetical protein VGN61_09025 [Verrucomicrobiae bacterium]|jgi:ABC-type transport system involved in multi-copper enzyme maturation permease subunit